VSGRRSYAVEQALKACLNGSRPLDAARLYGCHVRSVRRALKTEKPTALVGSVSIPAEESPVAASNH
jgi:predicted RNA binding protein with dsRBD fold (UPF0201 family)